jgi:hypothetical protein
MRRYLILARSYFLAFEGRHLYPGPSSFLFWLWLSSTLMFVTVLSWYLWANWGSSFNGWTVPPMLAAEAFFLFYLGKIRERKDSETLAAFNQREESGFSSTAECKIRLLRKYLGISQEGFLDVAEEILRLRQAEIAVERPVSGLLRRKWKFIFDPAAKDRLANLVLGFGSAMLAIAVAGDSKFDGALDILFNQVFQGVLLLVAVLAGIVFVVWLATLLLLAAFYELAMAWLRKFAKRADGSTLELEYLVRDLVQYHARAPLKHDSWRVLCDEEIAALPFERQDT